MESETDKNKVGWLLEFYYQSIRNVPILKYSRVLIVTILILAITAFFKLKNSDVFLYAIAVILISFLAFLFSFLLKSKEKFVKFLLYILITSIVLTLCSATLGFGSFIFIQKPEFYKRWFPDLSATDSTHRKDVHVDTLIKQKPVYPERKKNNDNIIKNSTPNRRTISIQLKEESKGYSKLFLDGFLIEVLPQSTTLNPRIELDNYTGRGKLLIITKNGDSCLTYLVNNTDAEISRIIPNCH